MNSDDDGVELQESTLDEIVRRL